MSCAMVYWGQQYDRFEKVFLKFGAVVNVCHLHDENVGRGEHPCLFDVQREESAV